MKILLVTPIRKQAGDPHYFWFKALRKLGCRVRLFPLTGRSRLITSWRLFQMIARFRPDRVFFSAGRDAVYPVKDTVFFCGVPPAWLSRSERATGLAAKIVVTNDARHCRQWQRRGAKDCLCLPISGVDPDEFKEKKLPRTIPVSFVGSLFRPRQRQLLKIARLYPDLKIWGWLPPKTRLLSGLKRVYQGEAWGKKTVRIYQQSLIGLNLAPSHMRGGGNIRPFEIATAGALLLTNQLNPDWWLDKKEAVKFDSASDCVKKINYYLAHQTQLKAVARAGRQRARRDHTYPRRFRKLKKYIAVL